MDSYGTLKAPAGTRIYAAPELVAGETLDGRCDIWSLGVIISEMLPTYRSVSRKCLARERERRYPDAATVKQAIGKARLRKKGISILLAAFILLTCSGAWAYTYTEIMTPMKKQTKAAPAAVQSDTYDKISEDPLIDIDESLTHDAETDKPVAAKETPETRPAAESIDTPPAEILDADALETLFNDAAQYIL